MLDCQAVLDKIFEYIDGELSDEVRKELKSHLDLCRHCFDRAHFEQFLREKLRQKTSHPCPEQLRRRIEVLIDSF